MKTQKTIRLHEFNGAIAFHTTDSQTLYLTPDLALKMAKELETAAIQIKNGYHYPTTDIEESTK